MKVLIDLDQCPLLPDINRAQHTVPLFRLAHPGLHEIIVVFEAGDLRLKEVAHFDGLDREHFEGGTDREHLHVTQLHRVHALHAVELSAKDCFRLLQGH